MKENGMPFIRPANILITGPPGIGKTTLVRRLAEELQPFDPIGFYTREIREKGVRQGFELVGLHGRRALLSHVSLPGPLIATIALKGAGLIREIKARPDVRLFSVSLKNRDSLPPAILSSLDFALRPVI